MFSISSLLGMQPVTFSDTSRYAIVEEEIEIVIGRQEHEKKYVWIRYDAKTGEYTVAFSSLCGAEESHELGVLTP